MKKFLNRHLLISIQLLVIAAVITMAAWATHKSKAAVRSEVQSAISLHTTALRDLAVVTDRNGADSVVSEIVTDCPRRDEFESLLVKLGSLTYRELLDSQRLFESCGAFYAERKALMVARLDREQQALTESVNLLSVLDPQSGEDYQIDDWESLVNLEQKRSDMLNEQVVIQEKIISLLISGVGTNNSEVVDQINKAGELAELLGVLDKQIDDIREKLM